MRQRGSAFDDFVATAGPGLMRMAVALTADRGAAEDLLQDVLERMYVAWPRVDDPLAYARRSLTNGSANRWRLRARRQEQPMAEVPDRVVSDVADQHGE